MSITIKDVTFNNIYKKKVGTKVPTMLTQSNIPVDATVEEYLQSQDFYKFVSALDIDWCNVTIDENISLNDTADLINWIKSLASKSYVAEKIQEVVGTAPDVLATLQQISNELQQSDENSIATIINDITELKERISNLESYHQQIYIPTYSGFCKLTLSNNNVVEIDNEGTLIPSMVSNYIESTIAVEIGTLCTSIGDNTFKDFKKLSSVIISDSVKTIGTYAFAYCDKITEINVPNSVTSIGVNAFCRCTGLTSFTIPSSITSFTGLGGCEGLTSITIPNNVTELGENAFSVCTGLTSINIPDSVTSIGQSVFFNCRNLRSINLGNNLQTIGIDAFMYCTGLTSIVIPDSVTTIKSLAFNCCSGLREIILGNSVETIGSSAFNECTGLTSITIPESVTIVENTPFKGCTNLTEVTLEGTTYKSFVVEFIDSVLKIYVDDSIIDTYKSLHPNYIDKFISYNSYSGFCKLTLSDNSVVELEGEGMITSSMISDYKSNVISVKLGTLCTGLDVESFKDCINLTSIIIPDSVLIIGNYALSGCTNLTEINIPNSVKAINSYSFNDCIGLTSFNIPDSVTSIGDYAFKGCNNIELINMPTSILYIGLYPFNDTKYYIENVESENGIEYLDKCIVNISDISKTTYAIRNDTKSILTTFESCTALESISLPSSLNIMIMNLFKNLKHLTSVNIPDSITIISDEVFEGCTNLTSVNIPNSVTKIGNYTFSGSGLTSIIIPDSVVRIQAGLFYQCTNLTSIIISNSATKIDGRVFEDCINLISITIKNPNPPIIYLNVPDPFTNCRNLIHIYVPEESVNIYKSSSYWNTKSSIISAIPEQD